MATSRNYGPDRRTFFATLTAVAGALSLPLASGEALPRSDEWDLRWLDRLTGKHKQVFDIGKMEEGDNPLRTVRNYLNAMRDVLHLPDSDLNAVVAIAGSGFPINAGHELWAAYGLGEKWKIKDPATGEWSTRNLFLGDGPDAKRDDSVTALQGRGTLFWQCNNALNGVAGWLAHDSGRPVAEVRAQLLAGLNSGVIVVPAHTMMIGMVQERGCTYEKL
jgi:hypothetical protein